jgi:hypothetical protein
VEKNLNLFKVCPALRAVEKKTTLFENIVIEILAI